MKRAGVPRCLCNPQPNVRERTSSCLRRSTRNRIQCRVLDSTKAPQNRNRAKNQPCQTCRVLPITPPLFQEKIEPRCPCGYGTVSVELDSHAPSHKQKYLNKPRQFSICSQLPNPLDFKGKAQRPGI